MSVELVAPKGQYRVVFVDTFDNDAHVHDDYDDDEIALSEAENLSGEMSVTHVYDDTGKHLGSFGTF